MGKSKDHRLKLDRARQHLQALNAQVRTFGEREPYTFDTEVNAKSLDEVEYLSRVRVWREPPVMWSATIGDVLQGMRSALDQLAFALSVAHSGEPGDPEAIYFPILLTKPDHFARVTGKRIGLMHPDAQAEIEKLQPYHRRHDPESHPLWMLNELARIDRHRTLHVVPAVLYETVITFEELRDQRVRYGSGIKYGPFEDGAIIARFEAFATGPHPQMKVDISPAFGIAFEERSPGRGADVVGALSDIGDYIFKEVYPPLDPFL